MVVEVAAARNDSGPTRARGHSLDLDPASSPSRRAQQGLDLGSPRLTCLPQVPPARPPSRCSPNWDDGHLPVVPLLWAVDHPTMSRAIEMV
jgi:hypothetical protein